MRRQTVFSVILLALLATAETQAAELWVGAASADITPKFPVAMDGGRSVRIARSAASPCTVNALAVESRVAGKPADQAILVSCDVCVIRTGLQERFRQHVAARLPGFDISKLFLASTHTHNAPVLAQDRFDDYGDALQPKDYLPFLFDRMAEAVAQAWDGRKAGSVAWGLGHAVVGQNRRAVSSDGSADMYGKTNTPKFRRIEGYEDHAVDTLFFLDADRRVAAMAVTLACPAQSGGGFGADFWHDVRLELRRRYGDQLVVLGFVAPAGDQSPMLMLRQASENRMAKLRGLSRTQELGRRIAQAVGDTWDVVQADVRTDVPFVHRVERFDLPGRRITDAEYAAAKKGYEALAGKAKLAGPDFWNRRWHKGVVDRYEAQKTAAPSNTVEMHVLRLGDVAIATNPFELFVDYGMQIQGRSPAVQTVLIQLASPLGEAFYLPTPRAVEAGGYSAVPESSLVGPEGGQILVERTVESISQLFGK